VGARHAPQTLHQQTGQIVGGWILFSSVVGIWLKFRWQAFAAPLVFITLPAAVAGALLIYFARPRGGQQATAELSIDKHK